ncbi:MAG: hypothetical protein AABW90_00020 [Nanoarchaeota archaeon]
MKKGVIILFIVFWIGISLISAQEINFSYPGNVIVGKEFNVTLFLINFSDDNYDVKIDIKNGSNYISKRFWDNRWRENSWMGNAINLSEKNNETFRLNITENYEGLNNFSIKIRNSFNKEFKFFYLLNITNYHNSSSNSFQNNSNNSQNKGIFYNLSWSEEDIVNNDEFKIKVAVFNLEDKEYDVKLWIETDKVISERYDEKNNEWKSGIYYINGFFKGPGNKNEKIKIRIGEDNVNFTGEANLLFRIRDESEISYKINISEKNNNKNRNVNQQRIDENKQENKEKNETLTDAKLTANIIRLGKIVNNETEKTENINTNYIVYESKTEIIKKYSVYGFALLCVGLCILIVWRKM